VNPFDEHAANMAGLEAIYAQPTANGATGNYILAALTLANGQTVATAQYPATVGHFVVQQVLTSGGGGFTPRLMGQVVVRKNVLPATAQFHTGDQLTVAQVGGSVRKCQVENVEDTFTEWRLNLWDTSQFA
jgi:hypothetical protein